jgi:hypothetical protein
MAPIEQAIFTSVRTDRVDGYQLAAASEGIGAEDRRSLPQWGPAHDSLSEEGLGAASLNFHPLPSGAYCISRTSAASGEYSARRGPQVYTQMLVVEPEDLRRFANNPFRLLQAATAAGHVQVLRDIPRQLSSFTL